MAALASVSLHRSQLEGVDDIGVPRFNPLVVALDLVDSFYLFHWERLAAFFSLEHGYRADELGITEATDENGNIVQLDAHDHAFPCLATLCMGGSWSLYFCHAVASRCMVLAARLAFGLDAITATGQLVVDGVHPPRLCYNKPILAPYVDNCNAICWCQSDADAYRIALGAGVSPAGLAHRVECDGAGK